MKKIKRLRLKLMTIRYFTYGLLFQVFCLGELLAHDSNALYKSASETLLNVEIQDKSIEEIEFKIADLIVKGNVRDESNNETLPGVNVFIKGTNTGTVTSINGDYSLTIPDEEGAVLVFSSVGYVLKEIAVNGRTVIDVNLALDITTLEEIVVVGYGTKKKSDLTGSVASVNSSDFEDMPLVKIDQALQGRAAGVQVTQTSGSPDSFMKIRIRGANSINGGNNPLYIVDGMVVGNLDLVNVNDIESMDVLKDASATAIYGSRGANGVVLITTKKGEKGKTTVQFDNFLSSSTIFQELPVMEPWQFAEGVNYLTPDTYSADEIEALRQDGGVDWQNEFFKTALTHNHQLSISGGSEKTNYYISGSYWNAEGTIIDQNFKRYTLKANINTDISDKAKAGLNFTLGRRESDGARVDLSNGLGFDPTTPIYDEDGNYNFLSIKGVGNVSRNPLLVPNEITINNNTNRIDVSAYFNLELAKNLVFNTSAGIGYTNFYSNYYEPLMLTTGAAANVENRNSNIVQNVNRLTYTKNISEKHSIQFDAIHEQQYSGNNNIENNVRGFFTDGTTYKNLELGETSNVNTGESSSSLQSVLGRVNYSFDNKYFLTGSFRADGSSKFREDQRWGYFPSAAVAWRVSQESFMQSIPQISNLKLRTSYGVTGSQAIDALDTYSAPGLGSGNDYPFLGIGGPFTVGTSPSNRMANPDLTWEETVQINGGFDVGFLENKITLTFDAYKKTTSNLLLDRPLPEFVGPTVITQNIGKVENKGIEFTLGTNILQTKDWSINSTITFTRNVNEVLELIDDKPIEGGRNYFGLPSRPTRIEVGLPLGTFRGYNFLGVYQLGEEGDGTPGRAKYEDISGPEGVPDGLITTDDITNIGDGNPDFIFGWNGMVSYKKIDLNFLFTGAVGNEILNLQKARMFGLNSGGSNAVHAEYLNRWTPENPSNIPAGIVGTEMLSSQFIEDGSFMALRNVNLSYSFSDFNVVNQIGFDEFKIYASVENAFILTKYSGFDPESSSTGGSDLNLGIDFNNYPLARTYTLGIRLTF